MTNLDPAARVRAALGPSYPVVRFPAGTATAADAARAIGCSVAEIAKSVVFRTAGNRPALVVASGANRIDEKKVGQELGQVIHRADAAFVRGRCGFPLGGVAPVGHLEPPLVLLDEDLQRFATVWAAAGAPDLVFALPPADLLHLTGGRFVDIVRSVPPA